MLVPIGMGTSMVSPYKALQICVEHFSWYHVYEILLNAVTWILARFLHIYLLPFPRFGTFSIERFWFLFWSILKGLILKPAIKKQRKVVLATYGRFCDESVHYWPVKIKLKCSRFFFWSLHRNNLFLLLFLNLVGSHSLALLIVHLWREDFFLVQYHFI